MKNSFPLSICLQEYCDLMYNEAVEKSCETFCDSVSQKEAEPRFLLHLLFHQMKCYEDSDHIVSTLQDFVLFCFFLFFFLLLLFFNYCQASLTYIQLSDGNPLVGDDCNTFDILTILKINQKIVFRCAKYQGPRCFCPFPPLWWQQRNPKHS